MEEGAGNLRVHRRWDGGTLSKNPQHFALVKYWQHHVKVTLSRTSVTLFMDSLR